jgi:N-methylhydantoinase A
MERYLSRLAERSRHRIYVMQSNGGFLTAREAGRQAVRTVLSGPAGGVVGALAMARASGFTRVLGFDMGGTSTDVSLCDGVPRETSESSVDGLPVRVPMIDIHTVGAGGGSIARVDAGGLLRVGPESAGADPGPACYGAGADATVTDAHVVLGRIHTGQFLGGEMSIEPGRSLRAVERIAKKLNLNVYAAAEGILRVANANMERAIRAVSIERGHDPREYTLTAFGGGGALHACQLAAALDIKTVLVPRLAEALSAFGMLAADCVRDYSVAVLGRSNYDDQYKKLERQALRDLRGAAIERTADLRYSGQSYELTVPWNPRDPAAAFHAEHARIYGYSNPATQAEVVTHRVRARIETAKPALPRLGSRRKMAAFRRVYLDGNWHNFAVTERQCMGAKPLAGPALILDYGTTTLVPPGWAARLDRHANLVIRR